MSGKTIETRVFRAESAEGLAIDLENFYALHRKVALEGGGEDIKILSQSHALDPTWSGNKPWTMIIAYRHL